MPAWTFISRCSLFARPKWQLAAMLGGFLALVVPLSFLTTADAANVAPTARVVAPACGSQVRVEFNASSDEAIRFEIFRGDGTVKLTDAYVWTKGSSIQVALNGTETFVVKVGQTTLASAVVSPAAPCSPARYVTPAFQDGPMTALIATPMCGTEAPVVINNGIDGGRWFEVWTDGEDPDVLLLLASNSVITSNVAVGSTAQSVKVVWNGETIASKNVKAAPACSWTPAVTTTTAKPATTTTSSTATTSSTTTASGITTSTTTKAVTTTAAKACADAEKVSGFGCPVFEDDFTGTSLNTSAGPIASRQIVRLADSLPHE